MRYVGLAIIVAVGTGCATNKSEDEQVRECATLRSPLGIRSTLRTPLIAPVESHPTPLPGSIRRRVDSPWRHGSYCRCSAMSPMTSEGLPQTRARPPLSRGPAEHLAGGSRRGGASGRTTSQIAWLRFIAPQPSAAKRTLRVPRGSPPPATWTRPSSRLGERPA